jgi:hypothetical protein
MSGVYSIDVVPVHSIVHLFDLVVDLSTERRARSNIIVTFIPRGIVSSRDAWKNFMENKQAQTVITFLHLPL